MNVGKAIYSILSNNAALAEYVGTRIYPEMAPEDATFPFLVYSILSTEPGDTKSGSSTIDVSQVETYAVSPNYSDCMDVSEAARAALDRNGGNFSDVAIQSIQYVSADTEYNTAQRVYICQQRYGVRQLRTGQAPSFTVVGAEAILVTDGDSVSGRIDTLEFPPGSVSVSEGVADVNLQYVAYGMQMLQQAIGTDYLKGGSLEIDLDSVADSNPVLLPFGRTVYNYGSDIAENGTTGYFNLTQGGLYMVDVRVEFHSQGNGVAPHFYVRTYNATQGTINHEPEATAYINGQHGVTHDTAATVLYVQLDAGTRLYVYGYDESTVNGATTILAGVITIRRIA